MTPIASYPPTPRFALRQAPSQSAAPNAAGHPQTMETTMSPQPSSLKGSTTPRRSGILTRAFKACAQVAGRLVGRIAKRITGCITRLARKAARPLVLALALAAAATLAGKNRAVKLAFYLDEQHTKPATVTCTTAVSLSVGFRFPPKQKFPMLERIRCSPSNSMGPSTCGWLL